MKGVPASMDLFSAPSAQRPRQSVLSPAWVSFSVIASARFPVTSLTGLVSIGGSHSSAYGINLLVVPAMALIHSWQAAAALILAERIGRAIRKPTVEAMLSYST